MKEFIDFILQFANLNKQQTDLLVSKATSLELRKGEYFSEAGKIPRQLGFVLEGVFRFCYYNNKGEEITNGFADENNFITDYPKFESSVTATEYVQAVTDSKLIVFSKKDWGEISNIILDWDRVVAKVYQKCLVETIDKRSSLVSEDATTRYLSFIAKSPQLSNRIPLSYIASYLGITQQSLSRVRKKIR